MKIKETKSGSSLSEISHGETEVRFSMIDPTTGETISPFVKCKDYFNDIIWSQKTNKSISIYGLNWDPSEFDEYFENRKRFCVAVRITKKGSKDPLNMDKEKLDSLKRFFKEVESNLGFTRTSFSMCDEEKHIIIKYDRKWTDFPYLYSAFFLFIRMGLLYPEGKNIIDHFGEGKIEYFISPYDVSYFKSGKSRIIDIMNGFIYDKQKYEDYTNVSNVHQSSGICNYNYKK